MVYEGLDENVDQHMKRYAGNFYINMSDSEKETIRHSLSKDDVKKALIEIDTRFELLTEMFMSNMINFSNDNILIENSLYDRYLLFASSHHIILNIYNNYIAKTETNIKLFSLDDYDDVYSTALQVIHQLCIFMYKCGFIQKNFTKGIPGFTIDDKKKHIYMKNSIDYIRDFILEQFNSSKSDKLIESLTVEMENGYEVWQHLELATECGINFFCPETKRYKFFEQVLLAPLKLEKFIETNRRSAKNQKHIDEAIKLLKNIHPYDKTMEQTLNHAKEKQDEFFSEIKKNNVLNYCLTVFMELHGIFPKTLRNFYSKYYSSALNHDNTNFLKEQYMHIKTIKINNITFSVEVLPYLHEDFRNNDIFSEIKLSNETIEDFFHTKEN